MNRTALIDGDVLAWKACTSTYRSEYDVRGKHFRYKKEAKAWCDQHHIPYEEIVQEKVDEGWGLTKYNLDQMVLRILEDTEATDYEVWLSGDSEGYRDELAFTQPYKGNREGMAKPPSLPKIKSYLVSDYGGLVVERLEADDMLGIKQCEAADESTIICTNDKDLRMIPGHHYNLNTRELSYVTEDEADWWFYMQLLMGDRTDNIRGVVGIGDKTASKILSTCRTNADRYKACMDTYYSVYKDNAEELLMETAHLVWIQREEGVLWQPPSS